MKAFLLLQGSYLLRIIAAMACGCVIGFERENHMKMAGIRTHTIVALTSALMMIVSKYGFYDILQTENVGLDPSRVAASIVTAVGFLGASVIFTRKLNVSGLTTAAGIWATVGIGMALGAGMYVLGIFTTLLLLCLQFVLHRDFGFNKSPTVEKITLCISESADIDSILENAFTSKRIVIANIKATRIDKSMLEVKLYVKFPDTYGIDNVIALLKETPEIVSIDL